ncbi:MAG TPA: hypothetical protein VHB98_10060 [Chloroflexota bacterium]|nr:hypothetical protein [Chloroflexota bacterium]
MADEITSGTPAGTATCTLEVEEETHRLLEAAATQEGRSIASVLEDAVQLYLRSRSEGYQAHLELAYRYLAAPDGSDERALAGAYLSAALAREHGRARQERGGDVAEVRARLRKRQAQAGGA